MDSYSFLFVDVAAYPSWGIAVAPTAVCRPMKRRLATSPSGFRHRSPAAVKHVTAAGSEPYNRIEMVQRYVSSELTHFVGRSLQTTAEQYRLLTTNILASGKLGTLADGSFQVRADGGTHPASNEMVHYPMVCFCDIPVADLALHMKKYSRFGLAFKKTFLVPKGARPVFYVPRVKFGYGAGDFSFIQRFLNAQALLNLSSGPGGAVTGCPNEIRHLVEDVCLSALPLPLHVFGL